MKKAATTRGESGTIGLKVDRLGFDLRSLQTFLEVCATGSMSGAASSLGVTQPSVSQTIRALEECIGTALFDRELRPMAVTMAGDLLRERAVSLLEDARQIVPAVRLENRTKLSIVRIGAPDSASGLLTPAFAIMLRSHVKQLIMASGSTLTHRASFIARQLNMLITNEPVEEFAAFERHILIAEPFVRIFPATHSSMVDQDLAANARTLPLIRYVNRSNGGRRIERHLRRLKLDIPNVIEVERTRQIAALVERGMGWAITMPLALLEAQPDFRRLVLAPLPSPTITRRLTLVAHHDELGQLPTKLAAVARRMLADECLPRLIEQMPWLSPDTLFGDDEP